MAARTLEDRRDNELELARISLVLIDQGKEQPTTERLAYLVRVLDRARDAQEKIEKRDARRVRDLTRAT